MGYETRLIVGQLSDVDKTGKQYFIRIAELDLCKCGYESELYNIGTSVNNRNEVIPKYADVPCKKVYWSDTFKIDKENIEKTLFKEHSFIKEDYSELRKLLGEDREVVKENLKKLADLIEGWETKSHEDCYGDELVAIPLPVVLKAIKFDNAKSLIEDGETYRRFDVAIAMLESLLNGFPVQEVREDGFDRNLYCVLWGH